MQSGIARGVRIPGVGHPITIQPAGERVIVRAGGRVVAETTAALILREARLAPVYYIPLRDVDRAAIERSTHTSHCPYKGDASYYDLATGDGVVPNAIWEYLEPYDSVGEIAGHVAFYPHLVDISAAPM
ncbi:MAG: hypothetical protein QOJ34_3319 [Pseudonocardiales bacterium]|nr:hypothetical protein [Pseudonocardiales bacterium]